MSDAPHTAIGSWSGYIYQGICAAYHVLKLYYDKGDAVKDYALSLDSYEDFSIFNHEGKIISLHQCKCFADQNHDFSSEYEKMYQKRDDYVKADLCRKDVKMYFHTNVNSTIDNNHQDIEKYRYHDDTDYVDPQILYDKINSLIEQLNQHKDIPVNAELLKARLSKWIDENVFAVHQKYIDSPQKALKEYAADNRIAFADIIKTVEGDGYSDVMSFEEMASRARLYYCSNLSERKLSVLSKGKNINEEAINEFIKSLMQIPLPALKDVFVRLNPDVMIDKPLSLLEGVCGRNPSILFNVIKEFEAVDSKSLHWHVKGLNETPSTLDSSKDVDEHCESIWKNRTNLDVLYDYDWIVGDVTDSVESIQEGLNDVCDMRDEGSSEMSIFCPRRTGILSITDKRNGKFY